MTETRVNRKPRPGPPTKRTPAVEQALLSVLRSGGTRRAAFGHVGIHSDTFYEWMDRYPAFADAVEKAEADAEFRMTQLVLRGAATGDWRAAAWWLERRRAKDWVEQHKVQAEVVINVPDLIAQHLVADALPEPEVIDVEPTLVEDQPDDMPSAEELLAPPDDHANGVHE